MMMINSDRIFAILPSMEANKEMMKMLNIEKEDIYEDPDNLSSLEKIKKAIEAERDDLERYLDELKRYKQLMKLITSSNNLFHTPEEELGGFSKNEDFFPPGHSGETSRRCARCCSTTVWEACYTPSRAALTP
eukprot:6213400-Pleurochrysis_carterae.AAC.7